MVLIGDHKQLQPVIQDHVAKSLGLNVSMFERHSHRAMMLKLQYRMVSRRVKCRCTENQSTVIAKTMINIVSNFSSVIVRVSVVLKRASVVDDID